MTSIKSITVRVISIFFNLKNRKKMQSLKLKKKIKLNKTKIKM